WRPLALVACDGSTRDSGSHFQANATLHRHSAAATRPGADWPARAANEPTTGPMTTPRLVAADSHPSALARSCGAIVSATYACATPRSEEHTSELQSRGHLVCRLLLE